MRETSDWAKLREISGTLTEREIVWRDRYQMLESHGYRLRQRYKPDWKPSWLTTKRPLFLHDDFMEHRSVVCIDAIRISDGRQVFLKRTHPSSRELRIHRFLSDPERIRDSHNHTVPILDEFPDDSDPSCLYIVMPLLRPYDSPGFFSVDEVADVIKQLLEGLVYMHNLNVAHRDCSDLNIMMDPAAMYPKGFHPVNTRHDDTGIRWARPKHRRDVLGSIRYYYIDFGISTSFDSSDTTRTVVGIEGQERSVPELSEEVPYDPFLTDIFILGKVFENSFLKKYSNTGFLYSLVEDMTQRNPLVRCDAPRALEIFNNIISEQPPRSLRWRLKSEDLGGLERFFVDVDSLSHEVVYLAKHVQRSLQKVLCAFCDDADGWNGKADIISRTWKSGWAYSLILFILLSSIIDKLDGPAAAHDYTVVQQWSM
ncbi:hypothetical protein ACEPAH_4180 [Sanghuangporus vaninii]